MKLSGFKVGILRKVSEMTKLTTLLKEQGVEVVSLPVMECRYLGVHQELIKDLKKGWGNVVILTSSFAVDCLMRSLQESELTPEILCQYQLICVGKGTAKTLSNYYVTPESTLESKLENNPLIPEHSSQRGIWEMIDRRVMDEILYPRAKHVDSYLEEQLSQHNKNYKSYVTYENRAVENGNGSNGFNWQKFSKLDALLLTSPRTSKLFFEKFRDENDSAGSELIINWPIIFVYGDRNWEFVEKLMADWSIKNSMVDMPHYYRIPTGTFDGLVSEVVSRLASSH